MSNKLVAAPHWTAVILDHRKPSTVIQPLWSRDQIIKQRYIHRQNQKDVGSEIHVAEDGSLILTEWWMQVESWNVYVEVGE